MLVLMLIFSCFPFSVEKLSCLKPLFPIGILSNNRNRASRSYIICTFPQFFPPLSTVFPTKTKAKGFGK